MNNIFNGIGSFNRVDFIILTINVAYFLWDVSIGENMITCQIRLFKTNN